MAKDITCRPSDRFWGERGNAPSARVPTAARARALFFLLACVPALALGPQARAGVEIDRVAGGGFVTDSFSSSANLADPVDVLRDVRLYVYVSDAGNNIIYRLDLWAVAQPLIGDGVAGFAGDGATADVARVNSPHGLAVDPNGVYIYFCDTGNHRVRRMAYDDNTIVTVAGNGTDGFSGVGGPATAAALQTPVACAADTQGGLYIADSGADRVLYVAPDGTLRSIAGGGTADPGPVDSPAGDVRLQQPVALALASDGSLYVAEAAGRRVSVISPTGQIHAIADSRSIVPLTQPHGLCLNPDTGDLYISDGNRVLLYSGGQLSLFAGTGEAGYLGDDLPMLQSPLNHPAGLTWDRFDGRLLIADEGNALVRSAYMGILKAFTRNGLGLDADALHAKIVWPEAVAIDSQGRVLLTNPVHHLVWRVQPNTETPILNDPNPPGDTEVVAVLGDGLLTPEDGANAASTGVMDPEGLATAPDGSFYVADRGNNMIVRVGAGHKVSLVAGSGTPGFSGDGGPGRKAALNQPTGLALDGAGDLYIADTGNNRVRRLAPDGTISTVAGDGTPAVLDAPAALALDGRGRLYIADTGNNRVRRLGQDGRLTTVAGTGVPGFGGDGGPASQSLLSAPRGVWIDGAGTLFISDSGNNRIRAVGTDGAIQTVAGTGQPGSHGDGGDALQAMLHDPAGLAETPTGDLVFADHDSNRVRQLTAIAVPLAAIPAGPKAPAASTVLPGDVNGDGKFTVADVTLALRMAVGLQPPTAQALAAAGANGDGRLDVGEVLRLLRLLVGLATTG